MDASLRISNVVRLLLELLHLVSRRGEELQNLAPVRCVVNEPVSFEVFASLPLSLGLGRSSEKQTTSKSKRGKCPGANTDLSVLVQIAFLAVLHRSSHNFSFTDGATPVPHMFVIERSGVEDDKKTRDK